MYPGGRVLVEILMRTAIIYLFVLLGTRGATDTDSTYDLSGGNTGHAAL